MPKTTSYTVFPKVCSFSCSLAPKVAFHHGELHKVGFDTYYTKESQVNVTMDDNQETVS